MKMFAIALTAIILSSPALAEPSVPAGNMRDARHEIRDDMKDLGKNKTKDDLRALKEEREDLREHHKDLVEKRHELREEHRSLHEDRVKDRMERMQER